MIKSRVNVRKKKERESDAALLARLRKELAKPHLTKSVRENATKKQMHRGPQAGGASLQG